MLRSIEGSSPARSPSEGDNVPSLALRASVVSPWERTQLCFAAMPKESQDEQNEIHPVHPYHPVNPVENSYEIYLPLWNL